jgi:L-threonylcarbamoyladenylate synthase
VLNEISRAARTLREGHLVAMPTETVYGLAADATNPSAVARIYAVKGRPADHPLIVHFSDPKLINSWAAEVPDYATDLAKAFWPGPMTLVLSRTDLAGDFITGGQDTVAVRVPGHPVALKLLSEFEQLGGLGVAAPSANRFGKVSPTNAAAVHAELGEYLASNDLILEGRDSEVGIESTIIDCTSETPKLLRLGAITAEMITQATGLSVSRAPSTIRVSGSLASHYAPNAKVVLDQAVLPGEGLIALDSEPTPDSVIRLISPVDVQGYAQQLYFALRQADALGLRRVVAITPKGDGLAEAIRDRLQRASY